MNVTEAGSCIYPPPSLPLTLPLPPPPARARQFPGREREFIMGTVSLADSMGIAVAGAVSLPVHDALCTLPGPRL